MNPSGSEELEFPDALGALHSLLLGVAEVESFLDEVAGLAAAAVEPGVSCGITTHYNDAPMTSAASDTRAAIVDEAQYASGSGPCLEAMATGEVVEVPDQLADQRWAAYRRAALDLGVRWSLSLPLYVERSSVGAMNLYGFEPAPWLSGPARQRAEVFAGQASTALTLALRFNDQKERSRQLVEALQSRSVIDQALGILMLQEHCDSRAAFDLLRRRSQSANRKLRHVATALVMRASGHPIASPSPFGDQADSEQS